MIRWRNGKAGFVGAAKNLIKGVFQYQFTVTTEIVVTTSLPVGVSSTISGDSIGVSSSINTVLTGIKCEIVENSGTLSSINNEPDGVAATINDENTGVKGTIQ